MNVRELREALDNLPGHLPVHVAVNCDHDNGGGADTDYLYTLDVQRDNFPTQGNMAVIRIDYAGGTSALEEAWLREKRKCPRDPEWSYSPLNAPPREGYYLTQRMWNGEPEGSQMKLWWNGRRWYTCAVGGFSFADSRRWKRISGSVSSTDSTRGASK